MSDRKIIIITGPAASGKTTLVNKLADMGYYTVEETAIRVIKQWQHENRTLPWEDPDNEELFEEFEQEILRQEIQQETSIPDNIKVVIMDRAMEDVLAYYYNKTGKLEMNGWMPTYKVMNVDKEDIAVLLLMPVAKDEEYMTPEQQWAIYYDILKIYKLIGYRIYEELKPTDVQTRVEYVENIIRSLTVPDDSIVEDYIKQSYMNILREDQEAYPLTTRFTIQDHYASHHHFDLRIKKGDKAPSWALPKAHIPTKPGEKILAVKTPDHDIKWMSFKGEIPEGEYGAGTVDIYDKGKCIIYKWGSTIVVEFFGDKVTGFYSLVKTDDKNYLFIRMNQEAAAKRYKNKDKE